MTDRDSLLAAVLAAPDEDTPRLVYADACDETGDHDRAEFVRVQVELARIEATPNWRYHTRGKLHERYIDLLVREGELKDTEAFLSWCGRLVCRISCETEYRRGFVESVTCSSQDWLAHSAAILAAHPVRRVALTDLPAPGPLANTYVIPVLEDGSGYFGSLAFTRDGAGGWRCDRWPGITFTLTLPD
jgi:uncharacterized protein (TIGR02996 family)